MALVHVQDLRVEFGPVENPNVVVEEVSFRLEKSSALGIVGESGSGKSVSVNAILGLAPPTARLSATTVEVAGVDVLSSSTTQLRTLLRKDVGMVFQSPHTALNPRLTIGEQLVEALDRPPRSTRREQARRAIELLETVGIPRAQERLVQFPHELSGGLAQRAVIALALARQPRILVADEPTTALDARVQAQVLDLLDDLRGRLGLSVILVSHDLAVVAERTENILVMRRGTVVERGRTAEVLTDPGAGYTRALLAAVPRVETVLDPAPTRLSERAGAADGLEPLRAPTGFPEPMAEREELVRVDSVVKVFGRGRGATRALDGVSLSIRRGDSVGLVGESGSGKTTLARIIAGLETASSGEVRLAPELVAGHRTSRKERHPSPVQYVFQDSGSALDPHLRIQESIGEFLRSRIAGAAKRRDKAAELLEEVGLGDEFLDRFPAQLSGGQRQRVGIARALAAEPVLLIADEPVSALDVSVQARVVNLLNRLRETRALTSLVISHDIGVIGYLCNRVAVLRQGGLQEEGCAQDVLRSPQAPYTRELLAAVAGRHVGAVVQGPSAVPTA